MLGLDMFRYPRFFMSRIIEKRNIRILRYITLKLRGKNWLINWQSLIWSINFPYFMKPVSTLKFWQTPDSGPYRHITFIKLSVLILSSHLLVGIPSDHFLSCFSTEVLYSCLKIVLVVTCFIHYQAWYYLVNRTSYYALVCSVDSTLPLLALSLLVPAPCPQTPSFSSTLR